MQRSKDKVSTSDVGRPGGICPLGPDGKVPGQYVSGSSGSDSGLLGSNGKIDSIYIDQGSGSGLNADLLDGKHASEIISAASNITVAPPLVMASTGSGVNLALKAETVPSPSAIPMSDATGSLDSWVTVKKTTSVWISPTGTVSRATFDPSTVTLDELAQRVSALVFDLKAAKIVS